MQAFTDTAGRTWEVKLTARRLTRLRELLGFSIAITATPEGVAEWKGPEVARNPERFADVLHVLLAEQLDARGVTRDQFEEAFDEDTYRAAGGAFVEAILSFSLVPDALRSLFAGVRETDPCRPSTSNSGPTSSPAVPESTPATTPSAS